VAVKLLLLLLWPHHAVAFCASVQPNVCQHVGETRNRHLFSSAQCLGYAFEFGQVTDDLCLPPKDVVLSQVKRAVTRLGAVAVFVAADRDAMIADFEKTLNGKVRCQFPCVILVVFGWVLMKKRSILWTSLWKHTLMPRTLLYLSEIIVLVQHPVTFHSSVVAIGYYFPTYFTRRCSQ